MDMIVIVRGKLKAKGVAAFTPRATAAHEKQPVKVVHLSGGGSGGRRDR